VGRDFIAKTLHHPVGIPDEKRAKILWSLFCLETWYANEKHA
jgi:hypothetical protein